MKKNEVPQDKGALENFTREVCYVKNEDGKYETELSIGWETKKVALDNAWEEIERRKADALELVRSKQVSPILYFMEEKLMDIPVLSGYTGFWKLTIKRHLKYATFQKLSDKVLQKYADVFEVSLNDLKNLK